MEIRVLASADAVAEEGARVIAQAARTVAAQGRFFMAVSGGHTPWQMLRALAREEVPWNTMYVAQVDERVAPAGSPDQRSVTTHGLLLETLVETTAGTGSDGWKSHESL